MNIIVLSGFLKFLGCYIEEDKPLSLMQSMLRLQSMLLYLGCQLPLYVQKSKTSYYLEAVHVDT